MNQLVAVFDLDRLAYLIRERCLLRSNDLSNFWVYPTGTG